MPTRRIPEARADSTEWATEGNEGDGDVVNEEGNRDSQVSRCLQKLGEKHGAVP